MTWDPNRTPNHCWESAGLKPEAHFPLQWGVGESIGKQIAETEVSNHNSNATTHLPFNQGAYETFFENNIKEKIVISKLKKKIKIKNTF